MTKKQIALYEAQARHQAFNIDTDNATMIAAVKGYAAYRKIMDDNMALTKDGIDAESKVSSTDTKTNDDYKKIMSVMIVGYLEGSIQIANTAGEKSLANSLNVSKTYFYKAGKKNSVIRSRKLCKLMKDSLTILTNMDITDIAKITSAIDDFDNRKDLVIDDRQDKKSFGTDALVKSIIDARNASVSQYKLFHSHYSTTDANITDKLKLAHTPIEEGKLFTPVVINVVDDITNKAISIAVLTKPTKKATKSFKVDKDGSKPFKTHKAGITTYTTEAAGYETNVDELKVLRHKDNVFEIRLKKI